jgi:hypothetical protein
MHATQGPRHVSRIATTNRRLTIISEAQAHVGYTRSSWHASRKAHKSGRQVSLCRPAVRANGLAELNAASLESASTTLRENDLVRQVNLVTVSSEETPLLDVISSVDLDSGYVISSLALHG